MSNPDVDEVAVPIWPATSAEPDQCVLDPPHFWEGSRRQLNGGLCDGFVKEHQRNHPGDIWAQGLADKLRARRPELLHDGRDQAPGIARYLYERRAPSSPLKRRS